MQKSDGRIKIVNHPQNLGVYRSRTEAILNAKGKYILIMDPDDMFLNKNLFRKLYCYSSIFNLDIVEFSVYHQNEGEKNIFVPDNHFAGSQVVRLFPSQPCSAHTSAPPEWHASITTQRKPLAPTFVLI